MARADQSDLEKIATISQRWEVVGDWRMRIEENFRYKWTHSSLAFMNLVGTGSIFLTLLYLQTAVLTFIPPQAPLRYRLLGIVKWRYARYDF